MTSDGLGTSSASSIFCTPSDDDAMRSACELVRNRSLHLPSSMSSTMLNIVRARSSSTAFREYSSSALNSVLSAMDSRSFADASSTANETCPAVSFEETSN